MSDEGRRGRTHRFPGRPWVLCVEIEVKPGREAEFLTAVHLVNDEMRYEMAFIHTSLCAHPTTSNRFKLFEVWADRDDFLETQATRLYREPYRLLMEEILAAPFAYSEWYEIRVDHSFHVRHAPEDLAENSANNSILATFSRE